MVNSAIVLFTVGMEDITATLHAHGSDGVFFNNLTLNASLLSFQHSKQRSCLNRSPLGSWGYYFTSEVLNYSIFKKLCQNSLHMTCQDSRWHVHVSRQHWRECMWHLSDIKPADHLLEREFASSCLHLACCHCEQLRFKVSEKMKDEQTAHCFVQVLVKFVFWFFKKIYR